MPRFSLRIIRFITNSNPKLSNLTHKFPSFRSSSLTHTNSKLLKHINPNPDPNFQQRDFDTLCTLLKNPYFSPFPDLENALDEIGIKPTSSLLLEIYKKVDLSPEQALFLFKWGDKRSGCHPFVPIFKLMLNVLAKYGELKWALVVLLSRFKNGDGFELVSVECLGFLIRQYACSGMVLSAIRTFKFGSNLKMDLFEELLAALCKYGHVKVASDCVDRKMYCNPDWVPSIDDYNLLLDGWFRVRNVKRVERLLLQMRRENIVLNVDTYGILIGGYCGMGFVNRAIELFGEMRRCGVGPNREVYGSIVDALAGEGRLKEALGMLERFLVLESGPTLSTYNSLVKGFCVAGDLDGAGKTLKMMTSRGVVPSTMTYNYFFRYFAKHGEVEGGVILYRKMIESGYEPDRLTFHLLLKMLCERESLELAIQINKEMRLQGHDSDLVTSTLLINLLCKMHRLEEAVAEFEGLIQRGFVPKYITYHTLHNELNKKGLPVLAQKLSEMAAAVPSFTTSAKNFKASVDISRQRRKRILRRANAMSDILKTCSDPRELANRRRNHKITSGGKNMVDKG